MKRIKPFVNPPNSDPFATEAIRLALSIVANEKHQEGFAVDTLLQLKDAIEQPASSEPTSNPTPSLFGPELPLAQIPFPALTSTDPTDRLFNGIFELEKSIHSKTFLVHLIGDSR